MRTATFHDLSCLPFRKEIWRANRTAHPQRTSALASGMNAFSFLQSQWACEDHWVLEKNQPHRRIQMNKCSPDPRENKVEENCLSHSNSSAQRDSGKGDSHKTEAVARKIKHSGSKRELLETKDIITKEKKVT